MKVILDTNFLIYCAKEKLDYFEEINNLLNENFELFVPEQVIEELKTVSKKREKIPVEKRKPKYRKTTGKDRAAAELALKLLEVNKIKKIKASGKTVDEAIINLARESKKNIVCTLDREMRKILGRVILISRGKKLILTK
ncbi:PIN domain-containing protein [Candidatus Pacearchaeota archaeon]|nr:PIN domain-containing protein [Candidatus Pacearchaeota archaeon]MBD3283780.1 PIN domain-containing protein [Candidatus Pacearchaeota archaeon]